MKPASPPVHRGRLSIVACNSGKVFASRVEKAVVELIQAEDGVVQPVIRQSQEITFANGEIKTVIEENIRGDDVYVFQCIDDPQSGKSVNDNLMALVTAINAVYQSDPDCITAVIPQFPYSRQERKKAREPITARLVANLLETAGADRVITLDIHAEAIEGFFQRAILEDLHASKAMIQLHRAARLEEEPVHRRARHRRRRHGPVLLERRSSARSPSSTRPATTRRPRSSRACGSSATSRASGS